MTAGLNPYPKYKDSGVPWLAAVPEHWSQPPGRVCYREKKLPNKGKQVATVLSLSYGQIVIKPVEKLHGLVPASFETYQLIDSGDIIVRPTDLQNDWNSLRFGLSQHRGIITSAYMCLNTKGEMTQDYGYLLLHAYDLKKVFYGLGSGLRQNLDWSDFKYLPCLVPTLHEQVAIVQFIDQANRRINRFIRIRRRLIEVLNEQKQAIINRAVTRGLDPNAPLKPSGIDWLGDVPEHWEVVPLRWYVRIGSGDFLSGDQINSDMSPAHPNPVIGGNGVLGYTAAQNCDGTTIVIGRVGALCGNVHLVTGQAWITDNALRLAQVRQFRLDYLALQLSAMNLNRLANANAQPLITGSMVKSHTGVLPPESDQSEVVAFVRESTRVLETAIDKAKREIDLIREYRTRLIADVVTGKLDVRHFAPAHGDEITEAEDLVKDINDEIPENDELELAEEAADAND